MVVVRGDASFPCPASFLREHPPREALLFWCAPRRFEGIGGVSALTVAGDSACGLVGDEVWCWGSSAYGEVGLVTNDDAQRWRWFTPRKLLAGATSVASRYGEMCATLVDGGVTCWGSGSAALVQREQREATVLSNGCSLTPQQTLFCDGPAPLAPGAAVRLLGRRDGAFNIGTCAATSGGDVWCWELGDASRPWSGRVFPEFSGAVELAMGPLPEEPNRAFHACALLWSDAVRCATVRTDAGAIEVFPPRC